MAVPDQIKELTMTTVTVPAITVFFTTHVPIETVYIYCVDEQVFTFETASR